MRGPTGARHGWREGMGTADGKAGRDGQNRDLVRRISWAGAAETPAACRRTAAQTLRLSPALFFLILPQSFDSSSAPSRVTTTRQNIRNCIVSCNANWMTRRICCQFRAQLSHGTCRFSCELIRPGRGEMSTEQLRSCTAREAWARHAARLQEGL